MPSFEEHLELHRLDCSSSHNMLDNYDFVRGKQEEFGQEQIAPPPLLTGKDLIAAGYSPGRGSRKCLRPWKTPNWRAASRSKEEALATRRGYERASFGTSIHLRTPRG